MQRQTGVLKDLFVSPVPLPDVKNLRSFWMFCFECKAEMQISEEMRYGGGGKRRGGGL